MTATAARLSAACNFAVGARHAVPGKQPWRGLAIHVVSVA
jgi:hypothetical protein